MTHSVGHCTHCAEPFPINTICHILTVRLCDFLPEQFIVTNIMNETYVADLLLKFESDVYLLEN